ncbi:hypothetical protein [Bradyrhizobium sp. NP1]|jgi:hypothetical protein|uniref:hypothetical protein n=1 Tax=Bradyrhizobium sp. NP1 TaxID=3049772 RepID=UPI0025A64A6D|nr:hypothetical protein [Bradyrhizobium sp. NP1]WJR81397.1 hypothetical protein QOU61_17090 [Bradyrhizobium sp. NP1]
MNNFKPFDSQNLRIKLRPAPGRTSQRIAICLLVGLIVTVMIVWFVFLGWGAIEIVRSAAVGLKKLWTTFF